MILDMDGLMLDTERLCRHVWQQAATELSCDLTDSMYLELVGRRNDYCEQTLLRWFGPTLPLDSFRLRCAVLWDEHAARQSLDAKAGLVELLNWLQVAGVPWAVATSTEGDRARAKLAGAGLGGRVSCVVTGDQVATAKPAPDIYLEAARRLGVDPRSCIALEDSDAGVAAAHAAGMRVVIVPDLKPPSAQSLARAWRVCPTLHEVIDLVATERQARVASGILHRPSQG